MERKDIKTLVRLIKKKRKVDKQLLQALRSDLEKVPQLSARSSALTQEIDELLPSDPDPLIDL